MSAIWVDDAGNIKAIDGRYEHGESQRKLHDQRDYLGEVDGNHYFRYNATGGAPQSGKAPDAVIDLLHSKEDG